ncbi:hypothetical protein Bsp3421_004332 [Burkholderia sp. FERM BP-3421]|jgi:hypothetical protein|uniref:hypothetical protein n=1 Tax=Burkholderia sp. FERM BP-3421 TaxID=1494466 RepID=UPI00235DCAB2|nr:hypothetical protein [Burkholderia sp. FERM BP-3421]WDD94218.1 hypothetical protein Bsp3421_004332 [Burkholderia sp. FERM BP-3421]
MNINPRFSRARRALAASLLLLACARTPAAPSPDTNAAPNNEALIQRIIVLNEHGDPASLEKATAGYLLNATRKFNPNVSPDAWKGVQADVNEIIANKIRSGYGEQALLTRRMIRNAKLSDDELRHLIAMLEDPVMQRYYRATWDGKTAGYIADLSQQVNNQMWFVVSIVLRKRGLQTSDPGATPRPAAGAH